MNIENALKIRGWMSERELKFLAKMASQSKYIIEVGCFEGRSTRAMADNTNGKIYAVDPWNVSIYNNDNQFLYRTDDTSRHIFYRNLYDKIKDGTVIIYPKKFHYSDFQGLESQPECEIQWDFIFIDAAHDYKNVKQDIYGALKIGTKVIAGHDYHENWPGVIKAVDEILPISQKEDTIWWQTLK